MTVRPGRAEDWVHQFIVFPAAAGEESQEPSQDSQIQPAVEFGAYLMQGSNHLKSETLVKPDGGLVAGLDIGDHDVGTAGSCRVDQWLEQDPAQSVTTMAFGKVHRVLDGVPVALLCPPWSPAGESNHVGTEFGYEHRIPFQVPGQPLGAVFG